MEDWTSVCSLTTSDEMATALNKRLQKIYSDSFPEKIRTISNRDRPWMTSNLKRRIRRRDREYKKNGKSLSWYRKRNETRQEAAAAKSKLVQRVKNDTLKSKNTKEFFKTIKSLTDNGRKQEWKIQDMFPGKSDNHIANEAATFFNRISQEFSPLNRPITGPPAEPPMLHEVSSRLKHFKKPKSQVDGDIKPELVTMFSDQLAIPLHAIFKNVFETCLWSSETVTLIPKKTPPADLTEIRNLSCTPLFSKVLESFVLDRIKKEVDLSATQFGGVKGSSVDNFLIESWHEILRRLEEKGAAVNIMSIDFEKAFNRMSHSACIKELKKLGASPPTLDLVTAFLTNRTMRVKVGQCKSDPLTVPGGSPQGSILANILFCVTTNCLLNLCPEPPAAEHLETSALSEELLLLPLSPELSTASMSSDDELAIPIHHMRRPFRINDSVLSTRADQTEINRHCGVPDHWTPDTIATMAYIDDLNCVEKVQETNSACIISTNKRQLLVHAPGTQNFFEQATDRSGELGMRVNSKKTQLLAISANYDDDVKTYIRPFGDTEIRSGPELKILGFWFGRRPDVRTHIDKLIAKFRSSLWGLRILRDSGLGSRDLVYVYITVLRPVIEFASMTYHSLLTSTQSEQIERLQRKAMKIAIGPTISYKTVLGSGVIEKLSTRRKNRFKIFAEKMSCSNKYGRRWFREKEAAYNTRNPGKFVEQRCKTLRYYKSPINAMTRILNHPDN